MKHFFNATLILLCVVVLVAGCQTLLNSRGNEPQKTPLNSIRVASYNVHYILLGKQQGRWSRDHWNKRKAPMDAAFKALDADIISFQEMESFSGGNDDSNNLTRDWLLDNNPGYRASAVGDWRKFPSTQPIFYRIDKFGVLDQGWFFFSTTPDVVYSRTFNGSYPAFASWVKFRENATAKEFYVLNVHLDFSSRENRTRSVELIVERVKPWVGGDELVFLTGDLNARLGSSLHKSIEATGFEFVPINGATYHFNRGLNLFGAIDHIAYTKGAVLAGNAIVLRERFGDTWPTDHYPVAADFYLNEVAPVE